MVENNFLKKITRNISSWSVCRAIVESELIEMVDKLRNIEPDISSQEPGGKEKFDSNIELRRRGLQAFQCRLMLNAIETFTKKQLTVVDIGDSAGTHMLYLKELTKNKYSIDTIGINLDPRAIEKIKSRGQKAILCRAEDLDLGEKEVDLFTSFQMVEHLHNPAIFLYRLAKKTNCNNILITVPYMKNSRVGLHNIRHGSMKKVNAGEEHIFELSPEDWTLLMIHSGWKIVYSEIFYQYPRKWPILSPMLRSFWRTKDYEGFWGVILKKDMEFSNYYSDWE